MSNPTRINSGVPTGGQFARSVQAESAVTLDETPGTGSTPPVGISRFETSGVHRDSMSTGPLTIDRAYKRARSDAGMHLRQFRTGDAVVITDGAGLEHQASISSEDLITDDLGWPVSRTLTASSEAGDQSFAVNAHNLVAGRFGIRAAADQQSISSIEPPSAPVESRFATNGSQRAAAVPQYKEGAQPYQAELRQAMTYMAGFKTDDTVVVTGEQGQEHFAKITSDRRSDGEYGSPESRTMRASLGTNKYTYDVDAHKLAMGKVGMRHTRPDEQQAAGAQFEQADAAWAITKQERIDVANTRLAAANLPAVGEPAVAWEGTPSETRGTVHDMTERGSVAMIVDGRPGTSLVPAEVVSARAAADDEDVELREWHEAGIAAAEIPRWKAHGFRTDGTDEYGVPTLGAWKATGLKPRTAAQWRDQGIDPQDVAEWRQWFSADEAGRLKGLVSMEEAIRNRRERNSHPELWD